MNGVPRLHIVLEGRVAQILQREPDDYELLAVSDLQRAGERVEAFLVSLQPLVSELFPELLFDGIQVAETNSFPALTCSSKFMSSILLHRLPHHICDRVQAAHLLEQLLPDRSLWQGQHQLDQAADRLLEVPEAVAETF